MAKENDLDTNSCLITPRWGTADAEVKADHQYCSVCTRARACVCVRACACVCVG